MNLLIWKKDKTTWVLSKMPSDVSKSRQDLGSYSSMKDAYRDLPAWLRPLVVEETAETVKLHYVNFLVSSKNNWEGSRNYAIDTVRTLCNCWFDRDPLVPWNETYLSRMDEVLRELE